MTFENVVLLAERYIARYEQGRMSDKALFAWLDHVMTRLDTEERAILKDVFAGIVFEKSHSDHIAEVDDAI